MSHYYFNVNDGSDVIDREGTELLSPQVARAEALRLAGAIIAEAGMRGDLREEWSVEVTDVTGIALFRMDFLVQDLAVQKVHERT